MPAGTIMRFFITITTLVLSFFSLALYAQEMNEEKQKGWHIGQVEELNEFCDSAYGKDIRLVSGLVYAQPHRKADGHPFFNDLDWMTGSVTINDIMFDGIKLKYDIYLDNLVLIDESEDGTMKRISLNKNRVTAFNLGQRPFIKLDPSSGINIPGTEYFEILYNGKIRLLNRWTKHFENDATQDFPYGRFTDAELARYLLKQGSLFRITRKATLYKVFSGKKSDIKKYLKANRIFIIKKATDQKMAGLIEYCNSLVP